MLPGMFGAEVLFLFPLIFPIALVVMFIWVLCDLLDDNPSDSDDSDPDPAADSSDPAPPSGR